MTQAVFVGHGPSSEIIFAKMAFVKSKDSLRRHFSSPKWASSKDHNALAKHFISQILYANGSSALIFRAASLCVQVSNIDRRDKPNSRCAIYPAHDAADAVHLGPPRLWRRWTRRKNTQARRTRGLIPWPPPWSICFGSAIQYCLDQPNTVERHL